MKTYFISFFIIVVALTGCGKEAAEQEERKEKAVQQETKGDSGEKKSAADATGKDEEKLKMQAAPEKNAVSQTAKETVKPVEQKDEKPQAKVEPAKAAAQPKAPAQEAVPAAKEKVQEAAPSAEKPVQKAVPANPVTPQAPPKAEQPKPAEPKKETVSISIKGDDGHGSVLSSAAVELAEGDSVLDVLKKITKEKRIQLDYSGAGGAAYIEGIDNLYEFDRGPTSGWMFKVNGTFAKKSAGAVNVKAGDRIEWVYTSDLGKDVGAPQ
jgi:chemotaxis protein histidine kinase CheA